MTKILLTGSQGMLGCDLTEVLAGHELTAAPRSSLDITDFEQVREAVAGIDVVVNAAAYTDVDGAESHSELAFSINAEGPRNLARACREHGARLIQVSTDYVFDGAASQRYAENAPRNPVSIYGRSKAAGEEAVLEEHSEGSLIVRTAWLYGEHGSSFPATMLKLAGARDTIEVVTDQVGQPTWTMDLARQIRLLIEHGVGRGIFHGTNSGQTSWFDFARSIFLHAGLDPERIQPTTSEAFPRPAARPHWSVLGHDAWAEVGIDAPRNWQEALDEAFPRCFSQVTL